ncbi:MAG: hypothetical protein ACLQOO_30170 [Terriglobia bacterium]
MRKSARWTDAYPAWQKYADELEQLLEFAKAHGQFESYLGPLQSRDRQRASALMELRVARHLERKGFSPTEWSPSGAGGRGEFVVEGPAGQRVFVEVKRPDWQGEVSPEERQSGRLSQPKRIGVKAGATDGPWKSLASRIDKAYNGQKKFRDNVPNLLVVADDLFVSPSLLPDEFAGLALYDHRGTSPGYFTTKQYEKLGALAIFWLDEDIGKPTVEYHMRLFLNPNALPSTALPLDMQQALSEEIA